MDEETQLSEKLDELIFWTKFSALPTFTALLRNELRSDVDKLIYELSDGERSTREIARLISEGGKKVTHTSVANMWQKLSIMNLVMPVRRKGRYKKAVSLDSIGIKIPELDLSAGKKQTRDDI